jgi:hypothetical protein
LADGTKIGAKYVSESAAFTTIIPLYLIDKDGVLSRGSEKEIAIKNDFISFMIPIEEPSSFINATLTRKRLTAEVYGIANEMTEPTKTAYTKDGTTFVSKERMDKNIRAGVAERGDYEKVQVPIDTPMAGTF